MADDGAEDGGTSVFVAASDGLTLHVREYGTRTAPGVSVVCLPGFTRTAADFAALAPALAGGPPSGASSSSTRAAAAGPNTTATRQTTI